jgi:hypothetical protein
LFHPLSEPPGYPDETGHPAVLPVPAPTGAVNWAAGRDLFVFLFLLLANG